MAYPLLAFCHTPHMLNGRCAICQVGNAVVGYVAASVGAPNHSWGCPRKNCSQPAYVPSRRSHRSASRRRWSEDEDEFDDVIGERFSDCGAGIARAAPVIRKRMTSRKGNTSTKRLILHSPDGSPYLRRNRDSADQNHALPALTTLRRQGMEISLNRLQTPALLNAWTV
jgi:hypothetical protein